MFFFTRDVEKIIYKKESDLFHHDQIIKILSGREKESWKLGLENWETIVEKVENIYGNFSSNVVTSLKWLIMSLWNKTKRRKK